MAYADVLELHRSAPRRDRRAAKSSTATKDAAANPAPMTAAASVLAYLGAAPLLVAALTVVSRPEYAAQAQGFLVLYGAALVIFFAGVRWGVAVMKPQGPTMSGLFGAGAPFLAALPLFTPNPAEVKIAAIMALIAFLLIDDLRATRSGDGAPAWYLGVRIPLTVLIEVSFLVALAAGARG